MRYAALLRGINSGRNPSTKMDDLKSLFEKMGFDEVVTILASGNVVFTSTESDIKALEEKIESTFEAEFGFPSSPIVKTAESIRNLAKSELWEQVELSKTVKAYASFVRNSKDLSNLNLSYPIKETGFQLLGESEDAIISVIDLEESGSPDLMQFLDSKFGKLVTTRGWGTVERIVKNL